jgi:hypothetical protein
MPHTQHKEKLRKSKLITGFIYITDDSSHVSLTFPSIKMRVSVAVVSLFVSVSSAFAPPSTHVARSQISYEVPATTTLHLKPKYADESTFLPVVSLLSASIFLFAPLPPAVYAAETPVKLEQVAPEAKAVASTKSELEIATSKYAVAQKNLKAAQLADDKAKSVLDVAEKKAAQVKKNFLSVNDKLAKAKTTGKTAEIDALSAQVSKYSTGGVLSVGSTISC